MQYEYSNVERDVSHYDRIVNNDGSCEPPRESVHLANIDSTSREAVSKVKADVSKDETDNETSDTGYINVRNIKPLSAASATDLHISPDDNDQYVVDAKTKFSRPISSMPAAYEVAEPVRRGADEEPSMAQYEMAELVKEPIKEDYMEVATGETAEDGDCIMIENALYE